MRGTMAVFRRELRAYFFSPLAYVILAFFLIVQGYTFSLIVAFLSDPRASAGKPLELFFGHIGERKHGPVALVLGTAGPHLDPPANAVGAGRGRHLKRLALIGVDFRRGGEVERSVVARDLHRFDGMGERSEQ